MPISLTVDTAEAVEPPFPDDWFERIVHAAAESARGHGHTSADGEIALLIGDDTLLQQLNWDYRGQDKPTDVLSFEGERESSRPKQPRHLGDIAISLERARRQAGDYGHSFERELAYLVVHGTLHLLGYDHENDDEQAAMRGVEEAALTAVGLTRA